MISFGLTNKSKPQIGQEKIKRVRDERFWEFQLNQGNLFGILQPLLPTI